MFIDLESVSIFIRPGATDMRKQVNGLSVIVDEQMAQNPGSGSLYLFCSRSTARPSTWVPPSAREIDAYFAFYPSCPAYRW